LLSKLHLLKQLGRINNFYKHKSFYHIVFDDKCAEILEALQQKHKAHKRYADMMIAATAKAGNHIVVTRNVKHFEPLLPKSQIANWIDDKPN